MTIYEYLYKHNFDATILKYTRIRRFVNIQQRYVEYKFYNLDDGKILKIIIMRLGKNDIL